ncbi:GTPase [Arcanobacterium pinnipediorum]|uniref:50S ribosome-binding GTPase n=1 Tax=Arcanobacterium pinnipediorum TaxID=1503041 RepID=A0ABY5ALQ3_9ACTO|nr:GTPase [Arcanobacterium pinnipediorum]USR80174.1 50S ribosome-binding GTPase [Arcanobacterium pinnipediorum]
MNTSVQDGIELLSSVVDVAGNYLSPELLSDVQRTLNRVQQRQDYSPDTTVIAIAGPTGAGKSSLVNALIGQELVAVAATRPTTAQPTAVSSYPLNVQTDVTTWLGIEKRYERSELKHLFGTDAPFVVVDLPDIDSTAVENRVQAATIIEKADVIVWVVDPQKYADSSVHDEYLAKLREQSGGMLAVVNHSDRLNEEDQRHVRASLRQILDTNHIDSPILLTSATTGSGIGQLRTYLAGFAESKKAAYEKLASDIRTIAQRISDEFSQQTFQPHDTDSITEERLIDSALHAGGAYVLARLAGQSYGFRARKATRWPLTRWISKLKVDPLERFRLTKPEASEEIVPVTGIARSDIALGQTANEYHRYIESRTAHMPQRWVHDLLAQKDDTVTNLIRRADYIGTHTDAVARRHPLWWRVVNGVQWLLFATVIVGGGWLALRAFAFNIGIWVSQPPMVGIFPLPLVLVVGGIGAGWLVSLLSGIFVRRGVRRTENRIKRRLVKEFSSEMHQELIEPIDSAVARHQQLLDELALLENVRS